MDTIKSLLAKQISVITLASDEVGIVAGDGIPKDKSSEQFGQQAYIVVYATGSFDPEGKREKQEAVSFEQISYVYLWYTMDIQPAGGSFSIIKMSYSPSR